jgi:Fur family ferric uptake transcriptional regulator
MAEKKRRRGTRQRRVILEELKKVHSHPTAAELYEFARRRLPKISLGTVYRNLELLAADGTIQKLEISGTESRFDGNPEQHWHIRCVRCGRVGDLDDVPADPPALDSFQTLSGYKILGCRLEFSGLCPQCLRETARDSDEPGDDEAN